MNKRFASRLEDPEVTTVVIPARNEERYIGACLESVLAQNQPQLQILVVDGDSMDRTAEIVDGYARKDRRVELVRNPDRTIPRSLNIALSHARGPWLVRIDAHATVPPDYVDRLLTHLRTGRWAGVGGRKDGVGVTAAGRAVAAAMGSRFGVGNSTYHYGRVARTVDHIPFGAYPTQLVRELGGWNERLLVSQDLELDYRIRQAGGQLLFDPQVTIAWHCRQSVPELFRQYLRYGRDRPQAARVQPGTLGPRHLAPPMLVGILALAGVLLPIRSALAVAILGPYLLALVCASLITASKLDGLAARLWTPAAFFAMHIAWGIGFWEGLFGLRAAAATFDAGRTKRS